MSKLLEKGYESMNEFYMGRLTWMGWAEESFERFLNDTRTLNNERLDCIAINRVHR